MNTDETQIAVKKKRFGRLLQSLLDGRHLIATLDDDCPTLQMVKPVCSTLEDEAEPRLGSVKIPRGELVKLNPMLLK